MNWTKIFLLIISINCLGCALPKQSLYFYYSPTTFKKQGIEGYCKVGNKIFPATHVMECRLIREDAVFLGCGEYIEQDTFNLALWPAKIE